MDPGKYLDHTGTILPMPQRNCPNHTERALTPSTQLGVQLKYAKPSKTPSTSNSR